MQLTKSQFSFLGRALLGTAVCAALSVRAAEHLPDTRGTTERIGQVKPGETPQGLQATEWASIRTQIEQSRYRLELSDQDVTGANPRQGWNLRFDAQGLSLNPAEAGLPTRSPDVEFREAKERDRLPTYEEKPRFASGLHLRTTAIGRADALTPVTGATPVIRDNKVELRHAQATEWYVNSALGLEHGYTFERAPQGERGEVRIQLAVDGGFKAQSAADGVWLTNASGKERMRYHKLLVVDANKQTLGARLTVAAENLVQIAFDDTHATYPVIVDPLLINEEAKLTASDGAGGSSIGDFFGFSVAISGDTVVVGSPLDDIDTNANQGSAYVFVRNGTNWSEQAKLTVSDGEGGEPLGDAFGVSVAISGDTVVVGSPLDDIDTNANQGSTYVFVRSATTWSEQTKLTASDGAGGEPLGDAFGFSVAISGDTVVVGSPLDDIDTNANQGSTYVFVRSGTNWSEQAKLTVSDGEGVNL